LAWTWIAVATPAFAQEPVAVDEAVWTADTVVDVERAATDMGLGAAQGIVLRDGRVYAYGDVFHANPRVGVIREYTPDLQPTGRVVWLRKDGKPLIIHPTGLTWDDRWGTVLGDTVEQKARIYRLDWERAWRDGVLDHAVLGVVDDDAAINGCRPEFVKLGGRTLLATADYGDVRPEIRLYDPEALFAAGRSSAPSVATHRMLAGPFNQNLHWDAGEGRLTCVQNVVAGRGWRLDVIDLARGTADGRVDGPGVRVRRETFASGDELEGFWPLTNGRAMFAAARREANLVVGVARKLGSAELQTVRATPAPAKPREPVKAR